MPQSRGDPAPGLDVDDDDLARREDEVLAADHGNEPLEEPEDSDDEHQPAGEADPAAPGAALGHASLPSCGFWAPILSRLRPGGNRWRPRLRAQWSPARSPARRGARSPFARAATRPACRCSCNMDARLEPALRAARSRRRGARDPVVAYDRPGYGGSTRRPGRSVADCAADIASVCDALGHRPLLHLGRLGRRPARAGGRSAPSRPGRRRRGTRLGGRRSTRTGSSSQAGMGELNVESFNAAMGSEEAHRAQHELELGRLSARPRPSCSCRSGARSSAPPTWRCSSGPLADFTLEACHAGDRPELGRLVRRRPRVREAVGLRRRLDSRTGAPLAGRAGHVRCRAATGLWLAGQIRVWDARLTPERRAPDYRRAADRRGARLAGGAL